MGFDDRAADRQPDAEPFRFGAAEGGEEGAVRSAADAGSGVGDAYLDEVSGGAGDDLDLADGRTLHGLDGVADDVDQYLLHLDLIDIGPSRVGRPVQFVDRSERRCVGQEWGSPCRSRGAPYTSHNNNKHSTK